MVVMESVRCGCASVVVRLECVGWWGAGRVRLECVQRGCITVVVGLERVCWQGTG